MKKTAELIQTIIFLLFIGLFFILFITLPKRTYSERENRYLQTLPDFTLDSLLDGRFTRSFESYTTDQFPFRDGWITLKAGAEILSGKAENNGVYFCDGGTLIERFQVQRPEQLKMNVDSVSLFTRESEIPVYFALIPSAAEIWSYKLPEYAQNDSQAKIISDAYSASGAVNIDVLGALLQHNSEYVFYRTDHHWTSLGAYYGYTALISAMGSGADESRDYSILTPRTVSNSFYGTAYSSSGISWIEPDRIDIFIEPSEGARVTRYEDSITASAGKIYDESFLSKKDKYSMFMGGISPLETIITGADSKPSMLVIRDSYMDSLTPFLLGDFSELHIIDLRYFSGSLQKYIAENSFDMILVCYSVANFVSDRNIYLLNR